MIVSHARRFIFFHNPKAAGSSMRQILRRFHDDRTFFQGISLPIGLNYPIDFMHPRLSELARLHPDIMKAAGTYRSVVFVRNPYCRFISAVDQHFKTFGRCLSLAILSRAEQLKAIEDFILTKLTVTQVIQDPKLVHFSPQVWFIEANGQRIPHAVVPMDKRGIFLEKSFQYLGLPSQPVPRANASSLDLKHLLEAPAVSQFIRDFYAADFAFFAAHADLAHLLS